MSRFRSHLPYGLTGGGGTPPDGDYGDILISSGVWSLNTTGIPDGTKFLRDDLTWITISGGGDLLSANNLADLASIPTARTNLGLGLLATEDEPFFTTANIGAQSESIIDTLYRDTGSGRRYVTTAVDTFAEVFVAGVSSINNSDWSGTDLSVLNGGTGASTSGSAKANLGINYKKGVAIPAPVAGDRIPLFKTEEAITVQEMYCVLVNASTPSVTWTIRFDPDASATGTEVVTGGTVTTSTTSGTTVSSFDDNTIPANNWVWVQVTAQSGSIEWANLTLKYTQDN